MSRQVVGVVLVALGTSIAAGVALGAEQVIVVTGSGSAEVQPDRVSIEFTVVSRAKSAAQASAMSAKRTAPVLGALRALGIPDSATTSASFAVQPPWDYRRGVRKEQESSAMHRIRVRVSEIDSAGAIVEAVLDHGADRIETVSFNASNTDSARQAALAQAVKEARGDAEIMAKAAGGELGSLLELTTQGTAAPPRIYEARAALSIGTVGSSTVPSITPGPIIVSTTVLGRWEFVPERRRVPTKSGR